MIDKFFVITNKTLENPQETMDILKVNKVVYLNITLELCSDVVSPDKIVDLWSKKGHFLDYIPVAFAIERYQDYLSENYTYTFALATSDDREIEGEVIEIKGLVAINLVADDYLEASFQNYKDSFNLLCDKSCRDKNRKWSLEVYVGGKSFTILPIECTEGE